MVLVLKNRQVPYFIFFFHFKGNIGYIFILFSIFLYKVFLLQTTHFNIASGKIKDAVNKLLTWFWSCLTITLSSLYIGCVRALYASYIRLLVSLQLLIKLIQGKIPDSHEFDLIISSVVLSHQEKWFIAAPFCPKRTLILHYPCELLTFYELQYSSTSS